MATIDDLIKQTEDNRKYDAISAHEKELKALREKSDAIPVKLRQTTSGMLLKGAQTAMGGIVGNDGMKLFSFYFGVAALGKALFDGVTEKMELDAQIGDTPTPAKPPPSSAVLAPKSGPV